MKTNPYWKCIKLEGLQVETSTLTYKVFQPFDGISKSVSPDDIVTLFQLSIQSFILRAKYTRIFDKIKNDNGKIQDNTNILIMHCVVLNKNK
jgi:hypothetical protein